MRPAATVLVLLLVVVLVLPLLLGGYWIVVLSAVAVRSPRDAAWLAQVSPAMPSPTTIKSYALNTVSFY